jgi:hypothetical protein
MLAQCSCCFHIEVIERNDAIDGFGFCEVADAEQDVLQLPGLVDIGDVENVVEGFVRPVRVFEALGS